MRINHAQSCYTKLKPLDKKPAIISADFRIDVGIENYRKLNLKLNTPVIKRSGLLRKTFQ